MKRTILLTGFILATLVSTNSFGQTKKPAAKSAAAGATVKASAADLVVGKQALSKSDCLACHKEEGALVGPAYKEVAKKYPATAANIDMLTKKIIAGGSGNWGQVPMSPHPQLAAADVKKMVQYILSLK